MQQKSYSVAKSLSRAVPETQNPPVFPFRAPVSGHARGRHPAPVLAPTSSPPDSRTAIPSLSDTAAASGPQLHWHSFRRRTTRSAPPSVHPYRAATAPATLPVAPSPPQADRHPVPSPPRMTSREFVLPQTARDQ